MKQPRVGVLIGTLAIASVAFAQTPPDDRALMAERAAERTRVLQREADRLAGESRTILGNLRKLEIERQINGERLAVAEANLKSVSAALESARARVAALAARRQEATPALVAELVEIYKRGRGRHAQLLVASVADGRALGRLIRGAQALANIERARVDAHRRALQVEQEAVRELERRSEEAIASRDAQRAARAALDTSMAEHNRLIEAIDRNRDEAARYAGELQSARLTLDRTLASVDASAADAHLPIAPFKGALDWPVRGVVRTRFKSSQPGRSASAVVRNGIEFAATERSAVTAIHGGRVSYAAPSLGLGTLVVVEHGHGVQSLYGYLEGVAVRSGAVLTRGALIGQVAPAGLGQTGGAALYFELRVDGRPVDPLQWLRSSP